MNDSDKKNNDFSKAESLNMADVIASFNAGVVAFKEGRLDDSVAEIDKVISWLQPYVSAYHAARGLSYEKNGDAAKALEEFALVSEINSNLAQAHFIRGMVFYDKDDFLTALNAYTDSIKIKPQYTAYYNRALVYKKLKKFKNAIEDFTAAIAQNQGGYAVYAARGEAYASNGDYGAAIQDFTAAIRLNPDVPNIYAVRGVVYSHIGENEKAISDYTKAITLNPEYVQAFKDRAELYLKVGDRESAKKDFEECARLLAK